jgi:hypothetical protein
VFGGGVELFRWGREGYDTGGVGGDVLVTTSRNSLVVIGQNQLFNIDGSDSRVLLFFLIQTNYSTIDYNYR